MKIFSKIHNFLCDTSRVNCELQWVKKGWYIILLIISSIYVFKNFDTLVNQCFICKFDGNSLILILWLLLLIMPLINSIEGYGFKLNKEQAKQDEITHKIKLLRDDVIKQSDTLDPTELEKQLKDIQKEHTNAGDSRNFGLEKARGEYLLFLDSDDIFDRNLCKTTYYHAKLNKLEILLFGSNKLLMQTKEIVPRNEPIFGTRIVPNRVYSSKELSRFLFQICALL